MDRNSITKLLRDAAEALEHSSSSLTTGPPQQPTAECAPDRRTFGGVQGESNLSQPCCYRFSPLNICGKNQSSCFRNKCEVSCFNFVFSNIVLIECTKKSATHRNASDIGPLPPPEIQSLSINLYTHCIRQGVVC